MQEKKNGEYAEKEDKVINRSFPKPSFLIFNNQLIHQHQNVSFVTKLMNLSLHAAAALHATKTKLKVDHVTKQTEQWRYMATTIGDSGLASRLSIGDLGANNLFYQKRSYTKFYNDFIKNDNKKKQGGLDIP